MEEGRKMNVLTAPSIRGIVDQANHRGILKEDIIQLVKEHETYFLIFYS